MKKIVLVFLFGLLVTEINAQTPAISTAKNVTITQSDGPVGQVGNLPTNSTTQRTEVVITSDVKPTKSSIPSAAVKPTKSSIPSAANNRSDDKFSGGKLKFSGDRTKPLKAVPQQPLNKFDGIPSATTSPPSLAVTANNQSTVDVSEKKSVGNLPSNSTKVASAPLNNGTVTPTATTTTTTPATIVENLSSNSTKVAPAPINNGTVTATNSDEKPTPIPPTKVLTDKVTDSKADKKTPVPPSTSATSSKSIINSTSAPKEETHEKTEPAPTEPTPDKDTSGSGSTNSSSSISSISKSTSNSTSAPKEETNQETNTNEETIKSTSDGEDEVTTEIKESYSNVDVEVENPPLKGVTGSEESSSSNFPVMFLLSILAIVGGYFLYHNKSKLLGLIIEGRVKSPRSSSPRYNRLRNVEEAMPGVRSTKNV